MTLASVAGGFSTSPGILLAARATQGAGAAFAAPAALALLTTMFPEGRERLRAIGYYTAVSIGGSAVGLVAGGILIEWASWRWVMFVNAPIGIAVFAAGLAALPRSTRSKGHVDLAGALTSTVGMTALVYGLIQAGQNGWTDSSTIAALAFGVLLLGVFVLIERRAASPITPLRLFGDRDRVVSYVARLLLAAVMYGLFFFLAQFMQEVLGYHPLATGLAFLPLTACLFVASQTGARLAQRVPRRTLVIAGVTTSAVGVFWISHLSLHSGYGSIAWTAGADRPGQRTRVRGADLARAERCRAARRRRRFRLVNVTQQIGAALGLALLVTVFDSASHGTTGTGQAFVTGTDRAYLVAAVLLAAVVVIAAVGLRRETGAVTITHDEIEELELDGVETGV